MSSSANQNTSIDTLNAIAFDAKRRVTVLVRVNLCKRPSGFGAHMGGGASQFGIDEEAIDPVLERFADWPALDLAGFHVYSGSNSLDPHAIAENISNAFEAFGRLSERHSLIPKRLIVGAGFGIPYSSDQEALDLDRVAALVNPLLERVSASPGLGRANLVLELGRYMVGPFGYLLTSVVDVKESRGTTFAVLRRRLQQSSGGLRADGSIIRRNWPIFKITGAGDADKRTYTVVGPLCNEHRHACDQSGTAGARARRRAGRGIVGSLRFERKPCPVHQPSRTARGPGS